MPSRTLLQNRSSATSRTCSVCGGGLRTHDRAETPAARNLPIQRLATPDGDPNPVITLTLTAIEAAAAAPAHQTVNGPADVLGGPPLAALPNPGPRETFGLANYAGGNFAIGSAAFAAAAGAQHLGGREDREHAEIGFVANRGIPNSVWTTQDCCLFCFGYLDAMGIQHLPLRAVPFPQAWTHPTDGWQIVQRRPLGNRSYWIVSEPNGGTATYLLVGGRKGEGEDDEGMEDPRAKRRRDREQKRDRGGGRDPSTKEGKKRRGVEPAVGTVKVGT